MKTLNDVWLSLTAEKKAKIQNLIWPDIGFKAQEKKMKSRRDDPGSIRSSELPIIIRELKKESKGFSYENIHSEIKSKRRAS